MIFGMGTDLLRSERIEQAVERHGERFARRILMPEELARLPAGRRRQVRYLAMRFAGKEAVVKALGTGFAHGVWVRDVGIVQNDWGKPEVIFSPRGEALRAQLGVGRCLVTLTDEAGLVVANAIALLPGAG